jgi:uncharacterized protein (TIGR02466 family)
MAESTRRDRVAALFPTPVIFDELEDSAGLNRQLEAAILARRDQDAGMRLSNRGGWQSRHDFPDWSGEAGSRLIKHATGLASTYTTSTVSHGVAPWIVDSWANVSESGSFNMAHVHGATFWSCVYYVALGDGEGGALILHDPRMPALRMHAPHYRYRDLGAEVAADIKPKPGMMILFPGWLSHHVEPWRGTGMRISVAMNIRAVPAAHQFQATKSIGPFE